MQRIFLFPACFLTAVISFAQQYPFVHYTPKDGLVNSRVRKSFQDSKGRMYFLTYGGLSVFDGSRFRNYSMEDGLAANLVNDILEVGEDSLLIATNTGKLNLLVKGKISLLKTANDFCPTINYFYRHGASSIYLSSDEGLFQLEKNRIRELNILPLTRNHRLSYLSNLAGFGNYLILSTTELQGNEGIYLYDIHNNRICDSHPGLNLHLLGKDNHNLIWISTPDNFYFLDTSALMQGKISLQLPRDKSNLLKENPTFYITLDNNSIWLMFKEKTSRDSYFLHIETNGAVLDIPVPREIMASDIRHILIDREKTVWLASNGAGIYKIMYPLIQIFDNPVGKSFKDYIYTTFSSAHGTWFIANTNKLYRKSKEGLMEFTSDLKQSPAIFSDDGQTVFAHDLKNIYEAKLGAPDTKIPFHKIIGLSDSDNFANKLLVDPYGNIIASMNRSLGIWRDQKLVFRYKFPEIDLVEGLATDRNNLLWVVWRYHPPVVFRMQPNDSFNYLQPLYRLSGVMGSPRCFVFDRKGWIWIGTRVNGIYAYRQEGQQLIETEHFSTKNGMTDNFITSLACDSSNNIIVGTQTGLDRLIYTGAGYRVENSSKSADFFAYISDVWIEPNDKAFARTFSGGLLEVGKKQFEEKIVLPQLLIEEIRVNAEPVNEKTTFSYKQNNINFFVAAPSFIDEKQVSYSYMLKGSGNNQWSDTTASNAMINLTNLSPGRYKLMVKAFFPSTPYPPAETLYSFVITPPWWKTWWFRSIAVLTIIGLLIIGFRFYYRRRLEKQMVALEKQQAIEKERTRIATDMHDDLGAGLSKIKFLSETIGIKKQKQESFEEDISKIREYSHEMIDKMGEIVWALNQKNDSLSDLLSYSRSYAVEYLSQNGIKCDVDGPDSFATVFVSGEFRRNIYLTLKEALHNIVKHAQASQVNITIHVNHNLTIKIQDNGIGFDKQNIRPFSNGLFNMEKRMQDIRGSIQIKNNKGTSVELTAPLSS